MGKMTSLMIINECHIALVSISTYSIHSLLTNARWARNSYVRVNMYR